MSVHNKIFICSFVLLCILSAEMFYLHLNGSLNFSFAVMDYKIIERKEVLCEQNNVIKDLTTGVKQDLKVLWEKVEFKNDSNFPRLLTEEKSLCTIEFLHNVSQMLTVHDIEHVIFYGTLLGSYLSHSLLAWDDDVDVIILDADVDKLKGIFEGDKTWNDIAFIGYCQAVDIDGCIWAKYKLYWIHSTWMGKFIWKNPFLDITTYSKNSTHVWLNNERPWLFNISTFYPIRERPFGGYLLPSPHLSYNILTTLYYDFMNKGTHQMVCSCPGWDHWKHKGRKPLCSPYPCEKLTHSYPFVSRHVLLDGQTQEDLTIGNVTYYSFMNDEPFIKEWQPSKDQLIWLYKGKREQNVQMRLRRGHYIDEYKQYTRI